MNFPHILAEDGLDDTTVAVTNDIAEEGPSEESFAITLMMTIIIMIIYQVAGVLIDRHQVSKCFNVCQFGVQF